MKRIDQTTKISSKLQKNYNNCGNVINPSVKNHTFDAFWWIFVDISSIVVVFAIYSKISYRFPKDTEGTLFRKEWWNRGYNNY
jgi:hypothetical protein